MRVCHRGDSILSSPTILRRHHLDRKLSFYNTLPVNCEQDWTLSATVQFLLSPYDGAPYSDERHSSYLDPADDEETEIVKIDTIKKILV